MSNEVDVRTQMRMMDAQALFKECLRRYSGDNMARQERGEPAWAPEHIVEMSLRTMLKNGFTAEEIRSAMMERQAAANDRTA